MLHRKYDPITFAVRGKVWLVIGAAIATLAFWLLPALIKLESYALAEPAQPPGGVNLAPLDVPDLPPAPPAQQLHPFQTSRSSLAISTRAADLGSPLFPDYYNSPFTGWRAGSDQPFSLIPPQSNPAGEFIMEFPAPENRSGFRW
jgi:hypothetical protein